MEVQIDKIKDFILRTRNRKKYSQRLLAEKSGVSENVIARVELGRRDIGVGDLSKILNALGYKLVIEFVDDKENKT